MSRLVLILLVFTPALVFADNSHTIAMPLPSSIQTLPGKSFEIEDRNNLLDSEIENIKEMSESMRQWAPVSIHFSHKNNSIKMTSGSALNPFEYFRALNRIRVVDYAACSDNKYIVLVLRKILSSKNGKSITENVYTFFVRQNDQLTESVSFRAKKGNSIYSVENVESFKVQRDCQIAAVSSSIRKSGNDDYFVSLVPLIERGKNRLVERKTFSVRYSEFDFSGEKLIALLPREEYSDPKRQLRVIDIHDFSEEFVEFTIPDKDPWRWDLKLSGYPTLEVEISDNISKFETRKFVEVDSGEVKITKEVTFEVDTKKQFKRYGDYYVTVTPYRSSPNPNVSQLEEYFEVFTLGGRKIVKIEGSMGGFKNSHQIVFGKRLGTSERSYWTYDLYTKQEQLLFKPNFVEELRGFKLHSDGFLIYGRGGVSGASLVNVNWDGNYQQVFSLPKYSDHLEVSRVYVNPPKGLSYPAYHYRMNNVKTRGYVVFVHGGGCHVTHSYQVSSKRKEFMSLTARGYEVLAISYSNDVFAKQDDSIYALGPRTSENCGTDEIEDINHAYDHLRTLNSKLPIFLYGRSHGGYLTSLIATEQHPSKKWSGFIVEAGLWKVKFHHNFVEWAIDHYNAERDPSLQLDHLGKIPTLIYHGIKDTNAIYPNEGFFRTVGLKEAEKIGPSLTLLETTDKSVVFLSSETGDHYISEESQFLAWTDQMIKFLSHHSK